MAAERSTDRAPSVSSSITEAEAFDDEKDGANSLSDGFIKLKSPDEIEAGNDVERAELLPAEHEKAPEPKPDNSTKVAAAWMVVNTLATIGIVSL
jgi:solute carrier family 35 protein E3